MKSRRAVPLKPETLPSFLSLPPPGSGFVRVFYDILCRAGSSSSGAFGGCVFCSLSLYFFAITPTPRKLHSVAMVMLSLFHHFHHSATGFFKFIFCSDTVPQWRYSSTPLPELHTGRLQQAEGRGNLARNEMLPVYRCVTNENIRQIRPVLW